MKSFAISKALALIAILVLSSQAVSQKATQCKCLEPCEGSVKCEAGSNAWCACTNKKCETGCLALELNPTERRRRRFAADVLYEITKEKIAPDELQNDALKFANILIQLLNQTDGKYQIRYNNNLINFGLTPEGAGALRKTLSELIEYVSNFD